MFQLSLLVVICCVMAISAMPNPRAPAKGSLVATAESGHFSYDGKFCLMVYCNNHWRLQVKMNLFAFKMKILTNGRNTIRCAQANTSRPSTSTHEKVKQKVSLLLISSTTTNHCQRIWKIMATLVCSLILKFFKRSNTIQVFFNTSYFINNFSSVEH